jgi:6-phosphogluconate dehydrogenase
MKEQKSQIGLIGLAVMGANLARNLADKKIQTVVYNRTKEKTIGFIRIYGSDYLEGETSLKGFVESIKRPRKIIIMVKAGEPIDAVIKQLLPHLNTNDIIIDCGNSNYKDTQRRFTELKKKKINFIGCGVSGGEEGALNGPSLMPGGSKKSYQSIAPIFRKIAAKDFAGKPTLTYIGDNGAGHLVKTVHNGIEYGVMQIMAEAYDILRKFYKLSPPKIADIFEKYNKGQLQSYLFEIAITVLNQKDDLKRGYLVNKILDKASQKGTGKWTAQAALEQGVATPSITEAVFARVLSSEKDRRTHISKLYKAEKKRRKVPLKKFIKYLEKALYAAMLSNYAQGYDLISKTAEAEKWNINLKEISRIWEGGCIIRAKILNFLHKNATTNKHLFEIPKIAKEMKRNIPHLRFIAAFGTENGIPISGLSASLNYFESITQESLPANFIQGLRDYFGAHTYERTDRKGTYHTKWQ